MDLPPPSIDLHSNYNLQLRILGNMIMMGVVLVQSDVYEIQAPVLG